jgi:hypothetical protein
MGRYVVAMSLLQMIFAVAAPAQLVGRGTLRADLNKDGKVSFEDFFVLADQFGRGCDSESTDPALSCQALGADIDGNQVVTLDDFFVMADEFGRSEPFLGIWERGDVDNGDLLFSAIEFRADGLFLSNFSVNGTLQTISVFPYTIAADTLTLQAGTVFTLDEAGVFVATQDAAVEFVRYKVDEDQLTLEAEATPQGRIVYARSASALTEPEGGAVAPALLAVPIGFVAAKSVAPAASLSRFKPLSFAASR